MDNRRWQLKRCQKKKQNIKGNDPENGEISLSLARKMVDRNAEEPDCSLTQNRETGAFRLEGWRRWKILSTCLSPHARVMDKARAVAKKKTGRPHLGSRPRHRAPKKIMPKKIQGPRRFNISSDGIQRKRKVNAEWIAPDTC